MQLRIKVVPKASRNRISGWIGDRLKIQVMAAPERGRANEAVIEVLAQTLDLPRSACRILSGHASPQKTAEIDAPEAVVRLKLPPA